MTDVVTAMLVESPSPHGGRLGRHIEHDPRSRDHAFGAIISPAGLHSVLHRRYGLPFDQGQVGSCTGNATAGAINTAPLHKPKRTLTEADALTLYQMATHLDSIPGTYPPDDTGSSGLAAAKAAKRKGYISSYKHAFSVEEAASALQMGPVITGVNWYEGFDQPDASGKVQIAGQVRGGHEFEVLGFQMGPTFDESLVEAENSWGNSWGVRGHFYFTIATWRQLLSEQGDVTVLYA